MILGKHMALRASASNKLPIWTFVERSRTGDWSRHVIKKETLFPFWIHVDTQKPLSVWSSQLSLGLSWEDLDANSKFSLINRAEVRSTYDREKEKQTL